MSCVCGAGSGSDGPEHTDAVETDDADPVEVASQCEVGCDMTLAQESSINKRIFRSRLKSFV